MLVAIVVNDVSGYIAVQWPFKCPYWSDPRIKSMLRWSSSRPGTTLPLVNDAVTWATFPVQGCMNNLRVNLGEPGAGQLMDYRLRISTNLPTLASHLESHCTHNYNHFVVNDDFYNPDMPRLIWLVVYWTR